MRAVQTATAVDAFTAEVIRNAVVAITGEMKTNLMRTAYSSIIYEAEDFTVGSPPPWPTGQTSSGSLAAALPRRLMPKCHAAPLPPSIFKAGRQAAVLERHSPWSNCRLDRHFAMGDLPLRLR